MDLNSHFSKRALVHSTQTEWVASPMPGVDRRMLDRIGDEVARATTIVRYAPDSHFSAHTHTGGEEFIVLDGVFQDEHGDFPVGTYVRNPPTTSHTPGSDEGCIIFVKLWQFDMDDRTAVTVDMNKVDLLPDASRSGARSAVLFRDDREEVRVEAWEADASIELDLPGGAEVLILEGSAVEGGDVLEKHDWLRLPIGARLSAKAGQNGTRVWMKLGHLLYATKPDFMHE
ncbi:ChrR-like anti-ECFsigma factor [Litoreibacter meonggei]|uniref:ChrR-like anti-ECFsigma factor n=1 Tax=Litoreibacter meonggei TaxID=1049199 RepID=A0A497VR23_9RHOB|nr:cupin domain-containing protein [Litoreibacter meonggei]RLJ41404.1 ChrR-like anti-ECFsigma factor [Litoreibacter meonggei]